MADLPTLFRCSQCEQDKPLEGFRKWGGICESCRFGSKTGEYQILRGTILEMLGGRCACCGEANEVFLAFDHINGLEPGEARQSGYPLLRRMAGDAAFRARFQVLCHNCNYAKSNRGGCPHQRLKAVA